MENVVGVVRGEDKISCFRRLLDLTGFDKSLLQACRDSGKDKSDFRVVVKPNMMVFINPKAYQATVTDKDLVEYLVDHIRGSGFGDVCVCEAQNDVGRMLRNHNVKFVAEKIGYAPGGDIG